MITVNKYRLFMYEAGNSKSPIKANTGLGTSAEDAIIRKIEDPWWYKDSLGYNCKKINYSVTFTAEIIEN